LDDYYQVNPLGLPPEEKPSFRQWFALQPIMIAYLFAATAALHSLGTSNLWESEWSLLDRVPLRNQYRVDTISTK
jgi:hypothetical protein